MSKLARRQLLTSLAISTVAGLPMAAILADPRLAHAAALQSAVGFRTPDQPTRPEL